MSTVSTFGAFSMAQLGIYAAQKAMQVTGNNITNVNTAGYTRQQLELESLVVGGTDRYASKWDVKVGNGVMTSGVSQMRDPYLDIRYRTEMSNVGMAQTKWGGLKDISAVLDEVAKGDSEDPGKGIVEAAFNDFIQQMQSLTTDGAGKDEYDTLVRKAAETLVSELRTYAEKLEQVKANHEQAMIQDVDTVNKLLTKIQDLNVEIRKSDIHGGNALELRDQRNMFIDELSQYVRINVSYVDEDIGDGHTVEKLIIKMDGGDPTSPNKNATLINGRFATQLELAKVPEMEADGVTPKKDAEGNIIYTDEIDPHFDITLKAPTDPKGKVMLIRDKTKPNGNIPFTDVEATDIKLLDNDLYGGLQARRELLTEEGEYTSADEIENVDPNAATKRGIPYYQNMLDAFAKKLADTLNEANQVPNHSADMLYQKNDDGQFVDLNGDVIVIDGYKKNADGNYVDVQGNEILFDAAAGAYTVDGVVIKDADGKPVTKEEDALKLKGSPKFYKGELDNTDPDNPVWKPTAEEANPVLHRYYQGGVLFSSDGNGSNPNDITAKNISVSLDWANGTTRVLQTQKEVDPDHPQSTINDNLRHMVSLLTEKEHNYAPGDIPAGADSPSADTPFFTGTFQDMMTKMASTLATDEHTTEASLTNYVSSVNDIYNDRDSVSGVDLNDEAIAMMQYNKSYSAACRLLTTLDEMLEKLINGTAL